MKFETRKLGELVINFDRKRVPLSSRQRSGRQGVYPYYGATSIMDYVDDYIFDGKYLLMGEDGTVIDENGKPILQIAEGKFWCNNHAHILQNTELVTFDYLYYLLKNTNVQSLVTGAVQPKISQSNMNKLVLRIHKNKKEQEKIARYLRLLDDKIELNSAINNNLEQQAQAIFKSWFIDFEPFSNRKPSEWSVSTLGNVSIMGAGGDKPQNVSPIKTDLYEYPIYSNGLSNEGLYGFTDKPKISEESVTVSARGTIGFVCLRHIPYVPIVRLVTLIPKTEIVSAKYLYLWLKQLHITGTGTTQQQLTVPDFQKTEILVPSQKIVTLFTATVEPIFEKIWANQNENEKLSSLRDTLLPKLMSGELDVSNIDI